MLEAAVILSLIGLVAILARPRPSRIERRVSRSRNSRRWGGERELY